MKDMKLGGHLFLDGVWHTFHGLWGRSVKELMDQEMNDILYLYHIPTGIPRAIQKARKDKWNKTDDAYFLGVKASKGVIVSFQKKPKEDDKIFLQRLREAAKEKMKALLLEERSRSVGSR